LQSKIKEGIQPIIFAVSLIASVM